jgi:hypothetical protein
MGKKSKKAQAPSTRLYLPSMSKTEDFLACQWPWKRELPLSLFTADYEARYGSAFHEGMASVLVDTKEPVKWRKLARKWSIEEGEVDPDALKAHVKRAKEVLVAWLRGGNPWKVDLAKRAQFRAEQAVAWKPLKKTARGIGGPEGFAHKYNVGDDEFPGTSDLVIDEIETKKDCPDLIVLDHKSGEGYIALPHKSGQMRSLSLALGKRIGAKRVAAVIFHAPREDSVSPTIYADEFEKETLKQHAEELKQAWLRIGDGSMRPGEHCNRCVAQAICPAFANALVKMEGVDLAALTPEKAGELQQITSAAMALAKKLREDILRPWLEKGGIGERDDGKLVVLKPKQVRNLSMASIERKLGPAEGAKKIAELDKEGLIELRTDWNIVTVNDDRG